MLNEQQVIFIQNQLQQTPLQQTQIKEELLDHLCCDIEFQLAAGIPFHTACTTTFVPDGSYQGYELKDGFWVNIPKVYDQVLEDGQAPRDFPVLDSENANRERKNIFGKKGKPKAKRRTNQP